MEFIRRLTAWLGRKSRTSERRKLFGRLIKIGQLRAKFPECSHQFSDENARINARLVELALADDVASVEARIEPVAPWPGLPTEGRGPRLVREGKQ